MPQCIFCEGDDLPEDTQECPNCGNKPFSGMYFDREQFARAEALEAEGKMDEAWALLYEEWLGHCDIDYFDDEMADELQGKLLELFDRQPSQLVQQRYELCKQTMEIQFYHAYFASEDTLKEGMKAMLRNEREDLMHGSWCRTMLVLKNKEGIQNLHTQPKTTSRPTLRLFAKKWKTLYEFVGLKGLA